jgi:hypothetical protein
MTIFRQRLRILATTLILFQTAALSIFVPPSCCLGAAAVSTATAACHDDAMRHCRMEKPIRPPCAMHHAQPDSQRHSDSTDGGKRPATECAMRAACGGQAAALFVALSHVGVLQDLTPLADSRSGDVLLSSPEQPILQFQSPDAPPPRA